MEIPPLEQRLVTQEALDLIVNPVGRIVLAWGFIEQSLDTWVRMVANIDGSAFKRLPTKFSDELRDLKRAFRTLPQLAETQDTALSLIQRAKVVTEIRDVVVHRTMSHFSPSDGGSIVFTQLRHDELGVPSIDDVIFSAERLRWAADETTNVAGEMTLMSRRLHQNLLMPPSSSARVHPSP
ncbi:hypothetical protein GOB98_18620 [Sinorhizobium meliloti]|nr:hypothetical protein [Sinorhizobium meliloti]MDW9978084.1 hypothetical protein [Sinorhizobium meliloti]MDX0294716.1 hypothetical protein [Sinorhizobium meliloti]